MDTVKGWSFIGAVAFCCVVAWFFILWSLGVIVPPTKLIKKLKRMFPGCELIKNDSGYRQGIPDWTLFYGPLWAQLEIKDSLKAKRQPNQDHYIQKFNEMGFAAFICPENEEEVLTALQEALSSGRSACVS
jgi:hypothetical protein